MKNLAGNVDCNADIERELLEAGIKVVEEIPKQTREVPWRVVGTLRGWRFVRAWYYWMVETKYNSLPMDIAKDLHQKWGQEVRVDGHCGCPAPNEWWGEEGTATHYHIDSQEGLNAFAEVLRKNIAD